MQFEETVACSLQRKHLLKSLDACPDAQRLGCWFSCCSSFSFFFSYSFTTFWFGDNDCSRADHPAVTVQSNYTTAINSVNSGRSFGHVEDEYTPRCATMTTKSRALIAHSLSNSLSLFGRVEFLGRVPRNKPAAVDPLNSAGSSMKGDECCRV